MTLTAFLLILVSVFLHAGWNFLSKAHRPSAAFYLVLNGSSLLYLWPFLLFSNIRWCGLPGAFWMLFAASSAFEVLYSVGLFRAYRQGDISLVYPLARAIPVLLVAAVTMLFGLGKMPGAAALAGMAMVSFGCLILPQKSLLHTDWKCFLTPALGAVLMAAVGTTGYTIVDSQATKLLASEAGSGRFMTAGAYMCMVNAAITLGLGICVVSSRRETAEFVKRSLRSPYPYLCGIFSTAAYLLVLVAMRFVTNVSYLQAFRQMSLPLGVAAGAFLLHERMTGAKIAGIILIAAGLVMTVL